MIVYKITGPTGKIYVGRTTQTLSRRIAGHKHSVKKFKYPLQKDFIKYGFDNFVFEEIEKCKTIKELLEKEAYWVSKLDCINSGYNLAEGGCGKGTKRTEEQKKNNSVAMKKWAKKMGFKFFSERSKNLWRKKGYREKASASARARCDHDEMSRRQALSVLSKNKKCPGIKVSTKTGLVVLKAVNATECAKIFGCSVACVIRYSKKIRDHKDYNFDYYKKDAACQ